MALNRLRTGQFLERFGGGSHWRVAGNDISMHTRLTAGSSSICKAIGGLRLRSPSLPKARARSVNAGSCRVPLPDDGEKPSQIEAAIGVIEVGAEDGAFREAWRGRFYQPQLDHEMFDFWRRQEAGVSCASNSSLESTARLRFMAHVKHANGGGAATGSQAYGSVRDSSMTARFRPCRWWMRRYVRRGPPVEAVEALSSHFPGSPRRCKEGRGVF